MRNVRLAFAAFLAVYGLVCMTSPGTGRLLDSVDLAIHETGHLVFAPFGEFMSILGGTLFQLIMPGLFVAHFGRRGDRYAAGAVLWWVAQNCWNISVYAADARSRRLPSSAAASTTGRTSCSGSVYWSTTSSWRGSSTSWGS